MEKICDGVMKKKNQGFTLIEQLVVLAILVSVLGFGAVRMSDVYKQNNISHLTKDLQTVLQFIQVKSMEEGALYKLSVVADGKKIQIERERSGEKEFKIVRSSWIAGIQTGKSITFQLERSDGLIFYPDGRTSKNRLYLMKENGERVSLRLKNRIGTVQIENA